MRVQNIDTAKAIVLLASSYGKVSLSRLSRSVVYLKVEGLRSKDVGQELFPALKKLCTEYSGIRLFIDVSRARHFPATVQDWTTFLNQHGDCIRCTYILTPSEESHLAASIIKHLLSSPQDIKLIKAKTIFNAFLHFAMRNQSSSTQVGRAG